MFLRFWHFIVFTLFLTLMPEILHANMIDSVHKCYTGAQSSSPSLLNKHNFTALREVREDDLASALESLIQYVGR